MLKNKVIYVIGCGGHARSVADVLLSQGKNSIIFIDKNGHPNEKVLGFPVVTKLPDKVTSVHVASGDNHIRYGYGEINNLTITASDAYIANSSQIGEGSFIAHRAFCGVEAQIGKGCIINTGAVIEHQVIIGDFTHIAPNSTICGKCNIGSFVLIGAGSTITPNISIGKNIAVGAGSVVVNDLVEPGIYYGVQAKLQKH